MPPASGMLATKTRTMSPNPAAKFRSETRRRSRSSLLSGRAMPSVAPDGSFRVAMIQLCTERTAVPSAGRALVSFSDSTVAGSDDRGTVRPPSAATANGISSRSRGVIPRSVRNSRSVLMRALICPTGWPSCRTSVRTASPLMTVTARVGPA